MHCCRPSQGFSSDHAEQEDDRSDGVEAITEGMGCLSSDGGEIAGRGRDEDDRQSSATYGAGHTQRADLLFSHLVDGFDDELNVLSKRRRAHRQSK